MKARFRGTVAIGDADLPIGDRQGGAGKGGMTAFARGSADIRPAGVPGGTRPTHLVDAGIGGGFAPLGPGYAGGLSTTFAETLPKGLRAARERDTQP